MPTNKAGWEILSEELAAKFKIFEARRSTRRNPRTGLPFEFFLIRGLNWVNVIPLTPDNKVVLVRQYRHGSEEYTIETPGGCVEKEEHPEESARRELVEETGFECARLKKLGLLYPNPAMQSMQLHVYVAEECRKISAPALDPGEDITIELQDLSKVIDMIAAGTISHALVVAAFALFQLQHAGPRSHFKNGS